MRTIFYILQKEFLQIFRNKAMLPIIFIMPIVQLLILVHAATFEMKNIDMFVVDNDLSATSRRLIAKFEASPFFNIVDFSFSYEEGAVSMIDDKCDVILQLPQNLEKELTEEKSANIQISINAVNGSAAGLINAYITSVLLDFNNNLILQKGHAPPSFSQKIEQIHPITRFWYNPELNYKSFMVPGILALLVTLIGMFLSGMNVVREKEIGTIEQINVTPIKKYQFIVGKLVPFWFIALVELAFGLSIGKILFDIPIVGSLGLIFSVTAVYLPVVLGLGLFISTLNNTQQQAMFVAFFFTIIFVLMSGLFTPVESMPDWAQVLNKLNPIAYYIKILRMVLLKGSTFSDIRTDFITFILLGIGMLSLATIKYRKIK